ncbi:MAG TPA: hypothetical protein VLK84_14305 [Longimicrobium sp.]|nr:hypothetical protein [Longimicrobium sp.]
MISSMFLPAHTRPIPVLLALAVALGACSREGGDAGPPVATPSASPPAAEAERTSITAQVATLSGTLTIERSLGANGDPSSVSTVKVNGRTVLADSLAYGGMEMQGYWANPGLMTERPPSKAGGPEGSTALIGVTQGGTGCPVMYHVVEVMSADSVFVTEPFEGCGEAPAAVWFDTTGALRMRFSAYSADFVQREPGYKPGPSTTWVYRGAGRLEKEGG